MAVHHFLNGSKPDRDTVRSIFVHLHEVIHCIAQHWSPVADRGSVRQADDNLEEGAADWLAVRLFPHLIRALGFDHHTVIALESLFHQHQGACVRSFYADGLVHLLRVTDPVGTQDPVKLVWHWTREDLSPNERFERIARTVSRARGGNFDMLPAFLRARVITAVHAYCGAMALDPILSPAERSRALDAKIARLCRAVDRVHDGMLARLLRFLTSLRSRLP
jgi:hypothetical protein